MGDRYNALDSFRTGSFDGLAERWKGKEGESESFGRLGGEAIVMLCYWD